MYQTAEVVIKRTADDTRQALPPAISLQCYYSKRAGLTHVWAGLRGSYEEV
jgi:hypothetical protein